MILVTGATGTNGIEIIRLLAQAGIACRALVRSAESAARLAGLPGVELVFGDFARPDSLTPALAGVRRALLISAIDPRLPELQGNFIAAAKRAGVPHIVKFSGLGASLDSEWRFLRWHAEAEKQLEDSGVAFTHLRPNQFMQVYLRFAPTIATDGKFYAASRDSRVSPVDVRDIAAVAVALLTGAGHEGQRYEITGPEALSYAEIAERIAQAIGRPVAYVDVPPAAAKEAILASGAPEWFAEGQMEQFRERWRGRQSAVTTAVAALTGRPPRSFAEFARDHAAAFRGGQRTLP
jgi:uncharacterized protein YbjT (DUF2867 family)